jgi:hypothetical protein
MQNSDERVFSRNFVGTHSLRPPSLSRLQTSERHARRDAHVARADGFARAARARQRRAAQRLAGGGARKDEKPRVRSSTARGGAASAGRGAVAQGGRQRGAPHRQRGRRGGAEEASVWHAQATFRLARDVPLSAERKAAGGDKPPPYWCALRRCGAAARVAPGT